jgi:N6-L-threonylcarbamoyladenine synthase/N6-L-threonylcarbamoyladenine synthase/protein kinase Bud32
MARRRDRPVTALGIEGTAHTAGVGVVRGSEGGGFEVLSNLSDMLKPTKGGIHPREAAEHHAELLPQMIAGALEQAGVPPRRLDAVCFSQGPGLGPCLRTAATAARAFSAASGVPIVGVNHCVAHLEVGRVMTAATDPLLLYASGGNTQIIGYAAHKYRVFGETLDVGLGNMLDKFALECGLQFPGGPKVEVLARAGSKYLELPYSVKGMDLAFSGILTAALALRKAGAPMEDLCHSIQETCFAMLCETTERALAHARKEEVVIGGGVVQNLRLQAMVERMCKDRGARFFVPPRQMLPDNGAMIAVAGALEFAASGPIALAATDVRQRYRTDQVHVTWRA